MYATLDLKDKKLLAELDFNARATNSELAKKVLLTKKGIEYRIKQLEKRGIIQGYYPIINFRKLGFFYCRIFVKLQYANEKTKSQIENYVKNKKNINWALWARGDYDIVVGIWARTLEEFKKITGEFVVKFDKYIKKRLMSVVIELDQYPWKFLLGKKDPAEIILKEEKETESIDELDKKILNELAKNARQNSSEIARKIKSNYKTVSYRIENLKKAEILLGSRAIINHEVLGLTYFKMFLFFTHSSEEEFEKVKSYLKNQIEVIYIVDDIGVADLDIELMCASNKDFFDFIDRLQNNFPDMIREHEYVVLMRTIKISYLPNLETKS